MKRLKANILRGRGGNVALVTALLAPMVILVAGGAVDVTNASMRNAQLQSAADAAAVAAVARNSPAYSDALAMKGDGQISDGRIGQQALAVFNADLQNSHVTGITFNIVVVKTGTTISSTVTADANDAPAILGMVGRSNIALAVSSQASDNIPAYMNFYMLLDNTPSMGLGATPPDVSNIQASNPQGCSFACHATANSGDDYYTMARNYAIAHNISINMRIDVVRQATQQLTQTATNTEKTNGIADEFQMAVYDFGGAAYTSYGLRQDSPLSADLTGAVYNNANAVDLMTVPLNNYAYTQAGPPPSGQVNNDDEDTSFDYTMTQLGAAMVPNGMTGGNGSTAKAPIPVLFLVTDGMVDQNAGGGSRQMGGINPATCTALKQKGIKIAILYTTYLAQSINNDPSGWSQANVVPILPQIQPALQACSSGSSYFQAVNPTDGIPEAMAKLFQSVVAQVKITQ